MDDDYSDSLNVKTLKHEDSFTRSSRSWSVGSSFSNLDDPALLQRMLELNEEEREEMYRKLPEEQAIRIAESVNAMLEEGEESNVRGRHQRRLTQVAKLAEHINELATQQSDVDLHQQSLAQARKLLHELSIFLVEDKKVIVERLCIKYPGRGLDFELTQAETELDTLHNDFFEGPVTEEILSQELGQLHQYFLDVDKLHEDERELYETRIESLDNDLANVRSDLDIARTRIVQEKKKNATQDLDKLLTDDEIIQERIEILEIEKDGYIEKLHESNDALEKCKIQLSEINHATIQKDHSILEKDEKIADLQNQLEEARAAIEDLYETNEDLENERNDLERELEFWEQEEDPATQALLEEANTQIKNMETRLIEVEDQKQSLMNQIREIRHEVSNNKMTGDIMSISHDSDGFSTSLPHVAPSSMMEQLGDSFKFYPGVDDSEPSEEDGEKKQLDPSQTEEEEEEEEEDDFVKNEEVSKLKEELEQNERRRQSLEGKIHTLTTDLRETRQSKINVIKALSTEIDRMRRAFKETEHTAQKKAATIS